MYSPQALDDSTCYLQAQLDDEDEEEDDELSQLQLVGSWFYFDFFLLNLLFFFFFDLQEFELRWLLPGGNLEDAQANIERHFYDPLFISTLLSPLVLGPLPLERDWPKINLVCKK